MVGEQLRRGVEAAGEPLLEHPHDPGVQLPTLAPQQRGVGGVLDEGVPEGAVDLAVVVARDQHAGLFQQGHRREQGGAVEVVDGVEQRERELTAEDRSRLRDGAHRAQMVEARGEQSLEGGRHLGVAVGRGALPGRRDQLLDEQRNAVATSGQRGDPVGRQLGVAGQAAHQLLALGRSEGEQLDGGVGLGQVDLDIGAVGQHAEQTVVTPLLGDEAEQLERRGVAPVHVLGDDHHRSVGGECERPLGQRLEDPGAAQLRALGGETVVVGDADELPHVPEVAGCPQPQRRQEAGQVLTAVGLGGMARAEGALEHLEDGLEGAARGQLGALELEPHVRAVGHLLVERLEQP